MPQLSLALVVSDMQLGVGLLETPQLCAALLKLETHRHSGVLHTTEREGIDTDFFSDLGTHTNVKG